MLLHRAAGEGVTEVLALARALELRLQAHLAFPLAVNVVSLDDAAALAGARGQATDVVVIVALEPLWSSHASGQYRSALTAAGIAQTDMVVDWQDDERLLRAVVDRCRSALDGDRLDDAAVLFVADRLPPTGASQYHDVAQKTAARLVGMMAPADWRLAFWAPPASEPAGDVAPPDDEQVPAELMALLEWEWPSVLVVPLGRLFTSPADDALDERLAPVVREAGRSYRRTPALGADPALQAALADAVVDHLARRPLPSPSGAD